MTEERDLEKKLSQAEALCNLLYQRYEDAKKIADEAGASYALAVREASRLRDERYKLKSGTQA